MLHAVIAKCSTLFCDVKALVKLPNKDENEIEFSSSSLSVKNVWAQNHPYILSIHENVLEYHSE